jgi:hypothetical protein
MRAANDATPPSEPGALSSEHDVRHRADWRQTPPLDTYDHTNDPDDKAPRR